MNILSVDKKICTGCAACYNICPHNAISMVENEDGFAFPKVNGDCTDCGVCYARCPVISPVYDNNATPICHAVYGDEELRINSSSGGFFSILAEYVLKHKGYVCGAAYKDDHISVKHIIIDKTEQLPLLRSSKYMQSEINDCYRQIKTLLLNKKQVLFSGCPCQVAGLKKYLGKSYDNLITVDLVCHGVPSHTIFEKYLQGICNKTDIKSVNFRQKKIYGWTHTLQIIYNDGSEYYKPRWKDNYYKVFLSTMACRESCGDCRFNKLPRQGDFTAGDFWGIGENYAEFNDNKGVSLVLLNNKKAEEIFHKLRSKLVADKVVDIEFCRKANGNVFQSSKAHYERDRFLKLLRTHSFAEAYSRIKDRKFDVGIVGWWYGKNYGSALTYYALHEVVEGLGYDTLMLEWPWKKRPFPPISDNFVRRFAKKHYNMSAQYTFDEYPSLNSHIDQFMVGSDQLWNYWDSKDMGNYYMLDFVKPDHKKISYATSFGHPNYPAPKDVCEKQAAILKTFDAISVREDDGVKICKDVFGVNATQVFDPVFLCAKEKYLELINEANVSFEKPYLLAYILSPNKEKGIMLKAAADKLGLDLLIILDGQTDIEENKKQLGIENVRQNVGIEDWLAYIYNSSYVISDSFHGICFSIIFEKQFICILNKARGISRFNTLLGHLGLFSAAVSEISDIISDSIINRSIDYVKVNNILREEVTRSYEWLKNALSMPKRDHTLQQSTDKLITIGQYQKMDIMLILDNDYVPYALPFICSLICNNTWARYITFHIITDNLSDIKKGILQHLISNYNCKCAFYYVDVSIFDGLKVSAQYPALLYAKLIPHLILPNDLERVLYFDCDMINLSSLKDLYSIDLNGYSMAACYDVPAYQKHVAEPDRKGLDYEYVNSGTVLYNLADLRQSGVTMNTYLNWLNNNIQRLYEEQLLNNIFKDKILHLEPYKYNFHIGSRTLYSKLLNGKIADGKVPYIIHYMPFKNDSPIIKPWNAVHYFYEGNEDKFSNDKELCALYGYWWDYARRLPDVFINCILDRLKIDGIKKIEDDKSKWTLYSDFFKKAFLAELTSEKFESWCVKNKYFDIAIYGDMEPTKLIMHLLKKCTKVRLKYIVENIDKKTFSVVLARGSKQFPDVDIMFVCDILNYEQIKKKLSKIVKFPVVPAQKILEAD